VWARPGFDSFMCLPRLRFDPFAHQLDAAARVLRHMQGRAILADEVGQRARGRDAEPPDAPQRRARGAEHVRGHRPAKGELHVLFESGSSHHSDADHRVKTVHHAGRPRGRLSGCGILELDERRARRADALRRQAGASRRTARAGFSVGRAHGTNAS